MKSEKHLSGAKIEQAAALCCRISDEGSLEVLLISSRDTGRWVLPKGFVEHKETTFKAAQREAFEEAGVVGKVRKKPVGHYSYLKDGCSTKVAVHLLRLDKEKIEYRERGQRTKVWLQPSEAALLVEEPELSQLLASLETIAPLASQDRSILKKIDSLRKSHFRRGTEAMLA